MTINLITRCATSGAASMPHIYEETLIAVVEDGNKRPAKNSSITTAIA